MDLAIAGRVVMVLGGPPCETWGVARWNGGSRVTGSGPRAVRSSTHLWGLHDLHAGERQQVALGNALVRTVILFLAAARVYGFAAVMEHPQLPSWMPQAPSSWKLPELKLLAKAGGTESVHLDQCCCGTPWKKPTRLFAVAIPELGQLVARLSGGGRCCPALGHRRVALAGKGDDGVYRTAPAKTYNSVMCKVLADATFGSIERFLRGFVVCIEFTLRRVGRSLRSAPSDHVVHRLWLKKRSAERTHTHIHTLSNHRGYEPNALKAIAGTGLFGEPETGKVYIKDVPTDFKEYGTWRYGVRAAVLAAAPDPLYAMGYLSGLDNEDVHFEDLAMHLPIVMTRTDVKLFSAIVQR